VRQGCPVSGLLFILCVEMLAQTIRQDKNLRGLDIDAVGSKHAKITQYADDGTLYLNNEIEMKEAIKIIQEFGDVAGTELNLEKCEGLWLGSTKYKQNKCTLFGVKWTKEPIRCLSIYIGHNKEACEVKNWHDKIDEMKTILKSWQHQNLTLFGKVCILKTLAISKLTYSASCLTVPPKIVKDINNELFHFLWGNRDKIKRNTLYINRTSRFHSAKMTILTSGG
jgi:hypothetical protein